MIVTTHMRVFRTATRLKRDVRKYNGISIGILQAHVEGVDLGDFFPQPQYSPLCSMPSELH